MESDIEQAGSVDPGRALAIIDEAAPIPDGFLVGVDLAAPGTHDETRVVCVKLSATLSVDACGRRHVSALAQVKARSTHDSIARIKLDGSPCGSCPIGEANARRGR